jgi:putative ABC transport system permease protein
VGLDESGRDLKPWWRAKVGRNWFAGANEVIIGSEVAQVEMRAPGDKLFSPETGRAFEVAGVLEKSGTSDDSLFFVPLTTAQQMFRQPERLTAVAIRLRDPARIGSVATRLQQIPGAQVVTMTEMMGTFLNLLGSVRTLAQSVGLVALTISFLMVLNTLLAAVTERTSELSIMRALGASRPQIFMLLGVESVLLAMLGSGAGLLVTAVGGGILEDCARSMVPLAPKGRLLVLEGGTVLGCLLLGVAVGMVASLYPAWRASCIEPSYALREI